MIQSSIYRAVHDLHKVLVVNVLPIIGSREGIGITEFAYIICVFVA